MTKTIKTIIRSAVLIIAVVPMIGIMLVIIPHFVYLHKDLCLALHEIFSHVNNNYVIIGMSESIGEFPIFNRDINLSALFVKEKAYPNFIGIRHVTAPIDVMKKSPSMT